MAALPADTCRLLLGLSLNLLPSLPLEKAGEEDFQRVLHAMLNFNVTGYALGDTPFPVEKETCSHMSAFVDLATSSDFLHGTTLSIYFDRLGERSASEASSVGL